MFPGLKFARSRNTCSRVAASISASLGLCGLGEAARCDFPCLFATAGDASAAITPATNPIRSNAFTFVLSSLGQRAAAPPTTTASANHFTPLPILPGATHSPPCTIGGWSVRGRYRPQLPREQRPRKSFGHAAALFTRLSSLAHPLAAASSILFGFP